MDAVTFRTIGLGRSPFVSPTVQAIAVVASMVSACSILGPLPRPSAPAETMPPVAPVVVVPQKPPEGVTLPARPATAQPGPAAGSGRAGNGKEEIAALARTPDAVPRDEVLHPSANRPYVQGKRRFVPLTVRKSFSQRGLASWYGHPFHGRRTATGERYDMRQMTAAHPTLPLPSYARVRSLETGRTIIVRVNDRGPFIGDRVIDLSFAAAARLGFTDRGVTAVQVELIVPAKDTEEAGVGATTAGADAAGNAAGAGTGSRAGVDSRPSLAAVDPTMAGQASSRR